MQLNEAKKLANELLAQHGLTALGWGFEYDNAKRRAGACKYRPKLITLSREITLLRTEQNVRNTILHEIAHALCPKQGHNKVWRKKAIEIGCDGKRCYSDVVNEGKYIATCPNGHVHHKHRKSGRPQSCGLCSSTFNPKYILHFHENKK